MASKFLFYSLVFIFSPSPGVTDRLTDKRTDSLSLSLTNTHTHTHTHSSPFLLLSFSFFLSFSLFLSFSYFLSHSISFSLPHRVPSLPVAELVGHQAALNGIAWAPHSPSHICTISDDRHVRIHVGYMYKRDHLRNVLRCFKIV